jgi:signal transduction histidine kinase
MFDALLTPGLLSQWGLVGIVVLLVLFGLLVPVRTHNRELAAAIQRGDEWKRAAEVQDARNDAQAGQIAELLELARTGNAIIQSLQAVVSAQRSRQDRQGRP